MIKKPPLILDFDHAVLPLTEHELRLPLSNWQERIRFGCTLHDFYALEHHLSLPAEYGCVFMGSGDFHHVSALLLRHRAATKQPFEIVVCDNHPDNMLYPFGIHCGSWVSYASRLPYVSHIHVIGITSDDITLRHAWENNWGALRQGKVSYWSIGKTARWLNWIGARQAHFNFSSADTLIDSFLKRLAQTERVYLSIDKDVFAPDVVQTNWDQGCFAFQHLEAVITACRHKLAGVDVTGEVSAFQYNSLFKRVLTRMDGLTLPDPEKLQKWQKMQQSFNHSLLQLLAY